MKSFSRLKIELVNHFPFISSFSRIVKADFLANSRKRKSYSQHGEDIYVLEQLESNFPNEQYKYIDVGAFHPMLLSNTYLLYRLQMNGAVVEPNKELINLHKRYRPKDIHLEVACSNENKISKFYLQQTFPALSSLESTNSDKKIKCEYVPVFNLNAIYECLNFNEIHFLSIDIEGFDFEALEGGENALLNTFMLCIECNDKAQEKKVTKFLIKRNFILVQTFSCNLIFQNTHFRSSAI